MNMQVLTGARIFDGERLRDNHVIVIEGSEIAAIAPKNMAPKENNLAFGGGIVSPAFLDLQVNGGAGLMIDGLTDLAALHRICATHLQLGSAGILATLITDTPEATTRVIATGIAAARAKTPGFLGLHLEGPHLDPRRKGAHDPALIRPMTQQDLTQLCDAARNLPALMVTIAPESVTTGQIAALAAAGIVVSLGHTDCSYETALIAMAAGARGVTHLFNAMSQLANRAPGVVGAALDGELVAGLIADGIHVNPAVVRIALAAKTKGVFLVSDCMAFAGSDLQEIELNGRRITRSEGRLTLADGSLAGADLTLPQALKFLVQTIGLDPARALSMATSIPAGVIDATQTHGYLAPGRAANLVHLDTDWQLGAVWHKGEKLVPTAGRATLQQ